MAWSELPGPVRATQVLMFVTAGLTFAMTLAFLVSVGVTAASLGASLWIVAPGVVSLVLAMRVPRGGVGLRRGIIALEIFYVLLALSRLGNGDPRGAVNLVLPVVVLILLFRRNTKDHFAGIPVYY
jgi:hypothetical protein